MGGGSCAGEQIVCQTRGRGVSARERTTRTEPFSGLSGYVFTITKRTPFSLCSRKLSCSAVSFSIPVSIRPLHSVTRLTVCPLLATPPLDCNPRKIFCPFYRRYTHVSCRRYVPGRGESSVEGGRVSSHLLVD